MTLGPGGSIRTGQTAETAWSSGAAELIVEREERLRERPHRSSPETDVVAVLEHLEEVARERDVAR